MQIWNTYCYVGLSKCFYIWLNFRLICLQLFHSLMFDITGKNGGCVLLVWTGYCYRERKRTFTNIVNLVCSVFSICIFGMSLTFFHANTLLCLCYLKLVISLTCNIQSGLSNSDMQYIQIGLYKILHYKIFKFEFPILKQIRTLFV